MDFGTELRRSREKAGLSIDDIARVTKIQPHKLDALESGAFERLPDGIYLDGIVRAYAAEVGLDPERTVERVRMEATVQYELIRESANDVDAFLPEDAIAPAASAPVRADDLDAIDRARADDGPPLAVPVAADTEIRPHGVTRLAIPALALFAAVGWGAYLYETSRGFRDSHGSTRVPAVSDREPATPPTSTSPAATENAPAPTPAPGTAPTLGPSDSSPTPDVARAAPPRDDVPAKAAGDRGPRSADDSAPVATAAESTHVPPPTNASPDAVRRDNGETSVDGTWTVATRVDSTSYKRFNGLRLGYQLELHQKGNDVTGTGRKVSENGRPIRSAGQTPIVVEGTIDSDRLQLQFTERGARRATQGQFDLRVGEPGVIRGRFVSDAARSAGIVELRRTSPR